MRKRGENASRTFWKTLFSFFCFLWEHSDRRIRAMPGTLSNDDLTRLYTWVDEINLSRPKRNIARDFSDGVLVAEVCGMLR